MRFSGSSYEARLDGERLSRQLDRVRGLMLLYGPGSSSVQVQWLTLGEISQALGPGNPEASVSARLRDLRKEGFGGYRVERRRRGEGKRGLFEYRVLPALEKEEVPEQMSLIATARW